MKKLFSLLSMLCMSMGMFAQGSLLATLSHEGEISTFYGAKALQDAHNAAVNGDVITLSSGTFNAVDITKAVAIRGAGMDVDSSTGTLPTIISGDFNINISDAGTNRLTMEGLHHKQRITYKGTLTNAMFLKCRFSQIDEGTNSKMVNGSFIHCKISGFFELSAGSSASCVNSFIANPVSINDISSNFEMTNCVVRLERGVNSVKSSTLINCAIYVYVTGSYGDFYWEFPSTTSLFNNVSNLDRVWRNCPNRTNQTAGMDAIFKTYREGYSDSENLELTDEAKTTYLGTDGKEIGIYGGSLPFSATPTNPQITKCEVASKSTADGKLSVDIVVNGAE